MWIFGYGSLIWKPGFPFEDAFVARLDGWERVFHQGSPDHRGTPSAPGRVVTLRRDDGAHCWGRAFQVSVADRPGILAALDHREKGGYERHAIEVLLRDGRGSTVRALTYIAPEGNPHHLGPAAVEEMVAQISTAHGPSGANRDYVLQLEHALDELKVQDGHVTELARALVASGVPWDNRRPSAED